MPVCRREAQTRSRPASAWLEFRCQPGLDYRPEYKGLTGTFEIDDLTTLENTQGK